LGNLQTIIEGMTMLKNPRTKRMLSVSLLALGGLFLYFAPEQAWLGIVLLGLGIAVEIAGIALGHHR
jgi:hypothetical protein